MSARAKTILIVSLLVTAAGFAVNEYRIFRQAKAADWKLPVMSTVGDPDATYGMRRISAWAGAICVVGIYSFLIKENAVYRFFEHLLLGTAMGFMTAVMYREVLVQKFFTPVYLAIQKLIGMGGEGETKNLVLVFAFMVGMLWYFQFSKKHLWLSRIAMGIGVGAGAGLGFKDLFNQLMPQVTDSFRDLVTLTAGSGGGHFAPWESLEALVFIIGLGAVLTYFFFAFEQRNPVIQGSSRLGRWFLMIALGAFFGNTFMSRLSALIERFRFLVEEWLWYA